MREKELSEEQEALRKVFVDSLYNYLEDQGAAFTIRALEKRLKDIIEDPNEREYGRINLEQGLNKLRAQGRINSVQHNGETHYFIPKFVPEIYVPINYSNVGSVIPQGEDIIYSTLCKATVDRGFGSAYVDVTNWVSHVLITKKGLAFTVPQKRKPNRLLYEPWYNISHTWNDAILLSGFKQRLVMTRDPNFESKEKFKERRLKAGKIFLPLMIREKETFLNSLENSNNKKRKRYWVKSSFSEC